MDNNNFYASFGFFPSLFGVQFQYHHGSFPPAQLTPEQMDNNALSRTLLFLGLLIVFFLACV